MPSSYGDAFADIYDAWYAALADDDFIDALASRLPSRPCRILELGVGTGRLLHKLVARRTPIVDDLVGIDASQKMLEIAQQSELRNVATVEYGDFARELPQGPFDAVFVGYNTLFNLPDAQSIASCLALVSSVLALDGFFMCDLVIPQGEHPEEVSEERRMANGDLVTSQSRHDPSTQTISGQFIQTASDGTAITRPWTVHYVVPHQLDAIAFAAGLHLLERTADGHGTTFTADSSRHISTYILG